MTVARIIPVPFTDGSFRYLIEVNGGATFSAGYYESLEAAFDDARLLGAEKVEPPVSIEHPGKVAA